ncbi:MAG: acyl-CoA dehydrogenase family protein [Dehalococcoidia bacterium]
MDFGLSETQELIRSTARDFFATSAGAEIVRNVADGDEDAAKKLWDEAVALGWSGFTVPEVFGGTGFSFEDLIVLVEEAGAALTPIPIVESSITSSVLDKYADDEIKSELLPQIAIGEVLITPAVVEKDASWDLSTPLVAGTSTGSDVVLTGEKRFVNFANLATHALVSATIDDELAVILVPIWNNEGVSKTALKSTAGISISNLTFNEVAVASSNVVATGKSAKSAMYDLVSLGAVARSAQLAGLGRKVVEVTTEYAQSREQFGKPIGTFQAIQHYLAEMATMVKQVNHLVYAAASSSSQDSYSAEYVSRAKIAASEKIPEVCWKAHQNHGAIGFTWEHDLHLFTRRAIAWKTDYGDSTFHKHNLSRLLGL